MRVAYSASTNETVHLDACQVYVVESKRSEDLEDLEIESPRAFILKVGLNKQTLSVDLFPTFFE